MISSMGEQVEHFDLFYILYCWWYMLLKSLWKRIWRPCILDSLLHPLRPSDFILEWTPERRYMYVYSSTVCKSPKVWTVQMITCRWIYYNWKLHSTENKPALLHIPWNFKKLMLSRERRQTNRDEIILKWCLNVCLMHWKSGWCLPGGDSASRG